MGARLALRTPTGRAAFNVVEYRLRVTWLRWFGERETAAGGAIGGVVRDEAGQPLSGATVLVATPLAAGEPGSLAWPERVRTLFPSPAGGLVFKDVPIRAGDSVAVGGMPST